jgi:2',3'-cyclic-nucleotide 2'-phosphodiesterase (5'-nucleotidase family)
MRVLTTTVLLVSLLCERLVTTALASVEPNLPFGDINVVVVTDVHSFVGGHRHDPTANANYGDVVSFYEHLKEYCDAQGQDLWFVMNGDWIHGTGLAMDGNAENLMPILNRMPWDAMTLGNHESYSEAVVQLMKDEMLPNFEGRYLTSNVKETATDESFGHRYTILEGINNKLMVFGFLYNHCEPSDALKVERVQTAVEEEWFTKALEDEEYDAIMVLAHMGVDDKYVTVLLTAIREVVGDDMPVQFITGHTHIRAEMKVDLWSHSFEAGAYLDTVGFVSFPTHAHAASVRPGLAKTLFQHQFMDGSVRNLTAALQIEPADTFATENGASLTQLIQDTQERLGLTQTVACPPHDYFRDVSIHGHNSIWDLWRHATKEQVLKRDPWSVMMVSKDALRHDVRGTFGTMELDDVVAIAPFMEPVLHLGKISSWVIRRANNTLNTYSHHAKVPDFVMSGGLEEEGHYDVYTQTYSLHAILEAFERLGVKDLTPVHTGERDTLYWLRFLEESFPCDERVKYVTPWFKDIHKLEEEAGDSHWGDEDSWDNSVDADVLIDSPATARQENQSNGYQGYLPPTTIDQYKDALPPGSAPTTGTKVVSAPPPSPSHPKHAKEELKKKQNKKHKLKRNIFKGLALVIGSIMLCVPVYCFVQSIRGRNQSEWDDEDGLVYDRDEMKALRSKRGRRGGNPKPRPRPTEIEIT